MRIPPYSIRHAIPETLLQWFHVETGTFHLSCGEYAVLPLDWTTILGLRFGGYLFLTDFVDFDVVSELLSIRYPLTLTRRQYFGPTNKPQIHMEWLRVSIPWEAELDDITLRWFFFYLIGSCLFGNNQSVLTCRLLGAMRVVLDIGAYDWGPLSYGFFITLLRQVSWQGFRSLEDYWQILTWWAYKYILALRPQYFDPSFEIYPRAYA